MLPSEYLSHMVKGYKAAMCDTAKAPAGAKFTPELTDLIRLRCSGYMDQWTRREPDAKGAFNEGYGFWVDRKHFGVRFITAIYNREDGHVYMPFKKPSAIEGMALELSASKVTVNGWVVAAVVVLVLFLLIAGSG